MTLRRISLRRRVWIDKRDGLYHQNSYNIRPYFNVTVDIVNLFLYNLEYDSKLNNAIINYEILNLHTYNIHLHIF